MSSETAIRLERVGKCYQTYAKPSHRLLQALHWSKRKLYREFWALRDVDLDVGKGETFGIVGKNGSGKSTLLQIVAGTLSATQGSVQTHGRISAILELGAGFNPEFTGMENARLNASIIGMSRDEIDKAIPAIIEFSELEQFINQPVKTYSSGMYVRLAFSVAISMRPDVLIIDEALAVGDIRFQRKCFRKLDELRNDGVTILFVTHATDSIVAHCDRAMLMDGGRVVDVGEPKSVVNRYLENLFDVHPNVTPRPSKSPKSERSRDAYGTINLDSEIDGCTTRATYNQSEYRWGNGDARIIDYLLVDSRGGEILRECRRGDYITVYAAVAFEREVSNLIYGLTVKTVDGAIIYGTNTRLKHVNVSDRGPGDVTVIRFHIRVDLIAAEYFISLGVVELDGLGTETILDRRYDLFHLKITDDQDAFGLASLQVDAQECANPNDLFK